MAAIGMVKGDFMQYKFKTKPYKHQEYAFNRFKDKEYFGLFCDMGSGKTKMSIDIMAYKYLKGEINACLVIAPNHVHAQWVNDEIPKHCPIEYEAYIYQSAKMNTKYFKLGLNNFLVSMPENKIKILAVNVEAFQANTVLDVIAEFVKNHECFIIVDESTRIKNSTAKRSKMIHKLNKYEQRCILTGTPTAKSPFDLYSQFEFLKANYFDCNFSIFQARYGVMMK